MHNLHNLHIRGEPKSKLRIAVSMACVENAPREVFCDDACIAKSRVGWPPVAGQAAIEQEETEVTERVQVSLPLFPRLAPVASDRRPRRIGLERNSCG